MLKQYDVVRLTRDLNPDIKAGMIGTTLEVWSEEDFEVEFVEERGYNYEHKDSLTFTISSQDFEAYNDK